MFIRQYHRIKNGRRFAYWALVESYRSASGPRQRVVAWLGKLDEAGRLGVQQAAEVLADGDETASVAIAGRSQPLSRQMPSEFDDDASAVTPRWVEVNEPGRTSPPTWQSNKTPHLRAGSFRDDRDEFAG